MFNIYYYPFLITTLVRGNLVFVVAKLLSTIVGTINLATTLQALVCFAGVGTVIQILYENYV